jgi:antitoxin component YwqK of YwqJK toxin-antitoxin module
MYKRFFNDILKILCYYKDNKLHGKYIEFNHNKLINKVSSYNNDILEGEEIQYYEHYGKTNIRKSYYKDGKLHGKYNL